MLLNLLKQVGLQPTNSSLLPLGVNRCSTIIHNIAPQKNQTQVFLYHDKQQNTIPHYPLCKQHRFP